MIIYTQQSKLYSSPGPSTFSMLGVSFPNYLLVQTVYSICYRTSLYLPGTIHKLRPLGSLPISKLETPTCKEYHLPVRGLSMASKPFCVLVSLAPDLKKNYNLIPLYSTGVEFIQSISYLCSVHLGSLS